MQSASLMHASARVQQLVSRQLSHVASPLAKPHPLGEPRPPPEPPPPPPPQAVEQLVSRQVKAVSSLVAPLGCAVKQAEKHASSVQLLPHVMSAVQSASEAHAVVSAQQLVSRHVLHVASGVERPHPPAPPAERTCDADVLLPFVLLASACSAAALAGLDGESFGRRWAREESFVAGAAGSVRVASDTVVVVQASVIVDVMAITPQIIFVIMSSKDRTVSGWLRGTRPLA